MIIITVKQSYWLTTLCLFVLGLLSSIRMNIGYTYICELIPAKHKTFYTLIWFSGGAIQGLVFVIYFVEITKHWWYLAMIGTWLNFISLFGIFNLPESPLWLVKRGEFAKAEVSL
jgi:MFS family permease